MNTGPQIFVGDYGDSLEVAALAERRESEGFDGLLVGDSQNRYCDPFVTLATVAARTSTLRLGTAVTNPVTRHPAALAGAFASLQRVSDGRVVAGIGRGDSSLAFIGAAPAPYPAFRRYLDAFRRYLRSEDVDISDPPALFDGTPLPGVGDVQLGEAPATGRLAWIADLPTVPVDVFATGPRMIALGAVAADRITVSVGADPERIAWAVGVARQARVEAGLDPEGLDIGASVAVGLHDDFPTARAMIGGVASVMARFAHMHGKPTGPVAPADAQTMARLTGRYDMRNHARQGSTQDSALDDEFLNRYAVVGPSDHCLAKLRRVLDCGVRRLHLVFHAKDVEPHLVEASYTQFAADVLPELKQQPTEHPSRDDTH